MGDVKIQTDIRRLYILQVVMKLLVHWRFFWDIFTQLYSWVIVGESEYFATAKRTLLFNFHLQTALYVVLYDCWYSMLPEEEKTRATKNVTVPLLAII